MYSIDIAASAWKGSKRHMPYEITYQPLNRIRGVEPKTVTYNTAAEAWCKCMA